MKRVLVFNLLSLSLIVCGAVILALRTPRIAPAARAYPLVLIFLVIGCALAVAAAEIARRTTSPALDEKLAKLLFARHGRARTVGFVATWLVYTWALPGAGFIAGTTCALSISLWLLGVRRLLRGIVAAALFSLIFSALFATVLYIPTPSGPLDRLLTQAIYAIQHRGAHNDH